MRRCTQQHAHEGDINSIRWDPSAKVCARGSAGAAAAAAGAAAPCAPGSRLSPRHRPRLHRRKPPQPPWPLQVLASGSDDGRVKLWSMTSERPLHVLEGHSGGVLAVRWGTAAAGRPSLASCSSDGTVRVWDTDSGACLHTLHSGTSAGGGMAAIAWSPDGTYLASGDEDGHVCVWSGRRGSLARRVEAGAGVYDLRWSRDGQLLAACAQQGRPILVADLKR